VRERLGERGLKLELDDDAKEFIIKKGGDIDYGARPLRRAVENWIEDPLSEELLKGTFQGKTKITVHVKEVGDQKQLNFVGSSEEAEEEEQLAAVGSGTDDADETSHADAGSNE
jgi:ATP-dependent Clp protease ATP-binding subunit ClpC